jgi:serine protein kinase
VLEQAIKREQYPDDRRSAYLEFIKAELAPRYAEFIGHEIQKAYLESYHDYGRTCSTAMSTMPTRGSRIRTSRIPTRPDADRELLNQELSKIEKPAGIANPKDFRNEVVKFTLRRAANNRARTRRGPATRRSAR